MGLKCFIEVKLFLKFKQKRMLQQDKRINENFNLTERRKFKIQEEKNQK